jgi:hypothetical protein
MTDAPQPDPTPIERVDDIPRIIEAMRRAIRRDLLRHKREGYPVVVWRNGRVEWIQPEDIPIEPEPAPSDEGR